MEGSKGGELMRTKRQNNQLVLAFSKRSEGEARSGACEGTEVCVARADTESPAAGPTMEEVLEPGNLNKALERVRRNKGAPGSDGMIVEELGDYLREQWPGIRARLLEGSYSPQPVRRVEIPKAGGGMRLLGVPTVLDRFIQFMRSQDPSKVLECYITDSNAVKASLATRKTINRDMDEML